MKAQLIIAVLILSIVLQSCTITGNVVKDNKFICKGGEKVEKVIKGQLIDMCCYHSEIDNRKIENCYSFDSKYSETVVSEDSMIMSRKITFPLNGMSCSEVYGRLEPRGTLKLIKELSVCKS